jgi:hypothetical protein
VVRDDDVITYDRKTGVAWPWTYAASGGLSSFRLSCRTFSKSTRSAFLVSRAAHGSTPDEEDDDDEDDEYMRGRRYDVSPTVVSIASVRYILGMRQLEWVRK